MDSQHKALAKNSDRRLCVVLFEPEIPGNTGSIGRTCVALNIELILIKPYGFDLSEKKLRRAGLDYWKFLKLHECENFDDFINRFSPEDHEIFLFENQASENFCQTKFNPHLKNLYFVFGSETSGLSVEIIERYSHRFFSLPMFSPNIRSLNLANATTAAIYIELTKEAHFVID